MSREKASDEEIINPSQHCNIAGTSINVSEITYMDGMRLHSKITPLITDMATAFTNEDASFDDMSAVFADHIETINQLISLTTEQSTEWVSALSDADGQFLLMTFWAVNADFFTRRVVGRKLQQSQAENQTAVPMER